MSYPNTHSKYRAYVSFFVAAIAVLSVGALIVTAQPAKRLITLDDFAKLRSVGDPQRSPDGKWVAYTVSAIDVEKDKRDTDLWMASWDGTEQVRLTSGPDGESSPRWSPDGRYLSFLASRGTEEEKKTGAQVWLLDRRGGEARKLTDIKGGVGEYAWSPDGKRLALVVSDPDPADEPEKMEGWKRKTKPPVVVDRYRFKRDRSGYLKTPASHLWLFDVEAGKAEQLTKGPYDDAAPAWSPDGTHIAFIGDRGADPDRTPNSDLYVIEAKAGAEPRRLTDFPGSDDGRPAWSPDGRQIAFFRGEEPRFEAYSVNKLAVVPAEGGPATVLTGTLDRGVGGPILWSTDGKSLLVLVDDDRAVYVGRVPAAGGPVEPLTTGRRTVSNISLGADGALTLLAGTATEIDEVHALETDGKLRRLSHQNDALFAELRLATTEDFTSKSKDGTVVNGLLVKPAGYEAGKRYPMLLRIHGGPNGQDEHGFSFERELFAANGYVVLAVNYRGSSGRGSAFQKAIFGDWGRQGGHGPPRGRRCGRGPGRRRPGEARDRRLELRRHPDRLHHRHGHAVQGGHQRGGKRPSAFDVRKRPVHPAVRERDRPALEGPGQWIRISYPFFKADRIKTPTLFLGGEKDFNVPIIGGEQMYQALKSLGVATQLVVYPGQFHGITMPSYVRDRYERYLAWYDKYLNK